MTRRLLLVVVAVAAVRGAAGQGDAPLVSAVAEAQANAVAAFFNYVVTLFNSADLPNVAAALVKPNVPTNVTVDPGTSVSGASEAVVTAVANNFVFPGLAHMSDYIYPMVRRLPRAGGGGANRVRRCAVWPCRSA